MRVFEQVEAAARPERLAHALDPAGCEVLRLVDDQQVQARRQCGAGLLVDTFHVLESARYREVRLAVVAAMVLDTEVVEGRDLDVTGRDAAHVVGQATVEADVGGPDAVQSRCLEQVQGQLRLARACGGLDPVDP